MPSVTFLSYICATWEIRSTCYDVTVNTNTLLSHEEYRLNSVVVFWPQLSDVIEIAMDYEDVLREQCIDELGDIEAPSEPGDTKKDPFNDIVTQLCPNNCDDHGVCNEGGCLPLTIHTHLLL